MLYRLFWSARHRACNFQICFLSPTHPWHFFLCNINHLQQIWAHSETEWLFMNWKMNSAGFGKFGGGYQFEFGWTGRFVCDIDNYAPTTVQLGPPGATFMVNFCDFVARARCNNRWTLKKKKIQEGSCSSWQKSPNRASWPAKTKRSTSCISKVTFYSLWWNFFYNLGGWNHELGG